MNKVFLSVKEEGTEESFGQSCELLKGWVVNDFTPYNDKYPTKGIAIYNTEIAMVFEKPELTDAVLKSLVDESISIEKELSFGSNDKELVINLGDDEVGDLFVGYITETKAEHSSIDFTKIEGTNVMLITNEDTLKELNKSQKTKLTKRKCKSEEDFLDTLRLTQ